MIVGILEIVDLNSSRAYFAPEDYLLLEMAIEPLLRYL